MLSRGSGGTRSKRIERRTGGRVRRSCPARSLAGPARSDAHTSPLSPGRKPNLGCPILCPHPLTCRILATASLHDPRVGLKLIYLMFSKLLGWMVLRTRSDTSKEIEILVLRHQLAVLQRRTPHRRMSWTDPGVIATPSRLLPVRRRHGMLVTPSTILRWHGQLVARR